MRRADTALLRIGKVLAAIVDDEFETWGGADIIKVARFFVRISLRMVNKQKFGKSKARRRHLPSVQ